MLDRLCTCPIMECCLDLFTTYFKLKANFIITLPEMLSHNSSIGGMDRTNIKQFTTLYQGQKRWSSLPYSVTRSNNLQTFKHSLKAYLNLSQIN